MRFPHSDTHGSRLICSSPWLFAACRVLLRLPMPRHSPCALFSLNFMRTQILTFKVFVFSHCQSFNCHLLVVVFYPMLYAYSFSRFAFSPFVFYSVFKVHLVGSSGLEPPTSRLSGARSSLLSYEPLSVIFSLPSAFPLSKWSPPPVSLPPSCPSGCCRKALFRLLRWWR